jgi:hypothetical protein
MDTSKLSYHVSVSNWLVEAVAIIARDVAILTLPNSGDHDTEYMGPAAVSPWPTSGTDSNAR